MGWTQREDTFIDRLLNLPYYYINNPGKAFWLLVSCFASLIFLLFLAFMLAELTKVCVDTDYTIDAGSKGSDRLITQECTNVFGTNRYSNDEYIDNYGDTWLFVIFWFLGMIQTIICLILFGLALIGTINNELKKGKTILQKQLEERKKHNLEQERRNIENKKIQAKERERARDYGTAIRIWEELGEIEAAARIRKLKAEQGAVKVSQKIVHGDEVTEIKDSVLNRSNVGGGSSKAAELREAKSLFEEGLIDDDEFKQMKKEILGK